MTRNLQLITTSFLATFCLILVGILLFPKLQSILERPSKEDASTAAEYLVNGSSRTFLVQRDGTRNNSGSARYSYYNTYTQFSIDTCIIFEHSTSLELRPFLYKDRYLFAPHEISSTESTMDAAEIGGIYISTSPRELGLRPGRKFDPDQPIFDVTLEFRSARAGKHDVELATFDIPRSGGAEAEPRLETRQKTGSSARFYFSSADGSTDTLADSLRTLAEYCSGQSPEITITNFDL